MLVNGKTQILGIFGNPISHTASPKMQNKALQHLNLNYIYIPFLVTPNQLAAATLSLKALNIRGINVTIPFKQKIIPYLDELDPLAAHIQAVNTVVNQNGNLIGYNTDAPGFIHSLEQEGSYDLTSKTVFLMGAGGAAQGIAYELVNKSIKQLYVWDKENQSALNLTKSLTKSSKTAIQALPFNDQQLTDYLASSDLVINTTPVGMEPHTDKSPLKDYNWVSAQHFCYDIIYKPSKTKFLASAEQKGAKILDGRGMLAAQGALAFKLFTGFDIPIHILKKEI
jgi:shikimate dehydrogenase